MSKRKIKADVSWFSDAPDWADPSWAILFPGLSEKRAKRILDLVRVAGLANGAGLVPPTLGLQLVLDRPTVQWLRAALSDEPRIVVNTSTDAIVTMTPFEARSEISGVIDALDEFLRIAEKFPVEVGSATDAD